MKKTIIKMLSVMLAVVITFTAAPLSGFVGLELPEWLDFSIRASAEETGGYCGEDLVWVFDDATGILTISGTGEMYDYGNGCDSPWAIYENDIKEVVIQDGSITRNHKEAEAVVENEVAATCTTDGLYESVVYCSICDEELSRETVTVNALGHTSETVFENEIVATCISGGSYDSVVYCSVCNEELSRETVNVEATGHTEMEVVENEIVPTCTINGTYETVIYCSICEEELSRETVNVNALGHAYNEVVTAPTCISNGFTTFTCSVCGDNYISNEIDAVGHAYEEVITAPTCTEIGYTTYTCTVCGDSYTDDETEVLGHAYNDVVTPPTCTSNGYTTYNCSLCGDSYVSDEVETTGHIYDATVIAPTCTTDGYTTYTCKGCGDSYTADVIKAFGHSIISVEAKAPTCTEVGYEACEYCSNCDYSTLVEIPATGHLYDEGVVTKEPSYTEKGEKIFTCSVCGATEKTVLDYEKEICYKVVLDKEQYNAGDTVTVSVFFDAVAGKEWSTGAIVFGCNSDVFAQEENLDADIKSSLVFSEPWGSFYKSPENAGWAWQTKATIYNNIVMNNTEQENVLFDQYLKYVIARNISGTHENATTLKNGLSTEDLLSEAPQFTFQLKIRDDVEDGTVINIGVPKGPMAKNYTYMNYFESPGSATKLVKTTADTSEVVWATAVVGVETPACPHENITEKITTVSPTCESEGLVTVTGVCNDCAEVVYVTTEAITIASHMYDAIVTAPTCTTNGYTTYICTQCGDSYIADEIEAIGHKVVNEPAIAPTCTEAGRTGGAYCTDCGEVFIAQTIVDALGHTEAESVVENSVDATCTADGSYDSVIYCSECNSEILRETHTVNVIPHIEGEEVIENETLPTCGVDGSRDKVFYCTVCNEELNRETVVIPATGVHTYGSAVIENIIDATCTTEGSYESVIYCPVCGVELSREELKIDATGHSYVDGVCENINCPDMADYYTNTETNEIISSYNSPIEPEIEGETSVESECYAVGVQSTEEQNNVTSIGSYAFYNCKNLKKVSIPNTVTSIGEYAFYGCESLVDISLPKDLAEINNYTFYGCTSLAEIYIPDSVTLIGNYAFNNCTGLIDISIGNNVVTIGDYAFNGCTSLVEVSVPDSVTLIGEYAFYGCSGLAKAFIGSGVTSIGASAFYNCTSLSDVLLSDGLIEINGWAFYGCSSLVEISIPDSVTTIRISAFSDCTSLSHILIGSGVTSIGPSAFDNCTSIAGFSVDENNPNYSNDEYGVLYECIYSLLSNEYITTLVKYPVGNTRTSYIIPDGINEIEADAFRGCTYLHGDLIIPDSVTSIGSCAFYECSGFDGELVLSENLTAIPVCAFYGCSGLTGTLVIPNSVESIESEAFAKCSSFSDVIFGTGLKNLYGSSAAGCDDAGAFTSFYGCSGITTMTFLGETVPYINSSVTASESDTSYITNFFAVSSLENLKTIYTYENVLDEFKSAWEEYVPSTVTFSSGSYMLPVLNLTVDYSRSHSVGISWSESLSEEIVGYNIYRNDEIVGTVTECVFEDSNLDSDTTYEYLVCGYTQTGQESQSSSVTVKTGVPKIIEIYTDNELNKVGMTTSNLYATVEDSNNLDGGVARFYYTDSNGNLVQIGKDITSYTEKVDNSAVYMIDWDITDINEGNYEVVFEFVDTDGESGTQTETINIDKSRPSAIASVVAIGDTNQIVLTWAMAAEIDTTKYQIYRRNENEENFTLIKVIDNRSTLNYMDKNVEQTSTYYYYVIGVNSWGQEGYRSIIASATPLYDTEAPTITKITPANGNYMTGNVTFTVKATDNIDVTRGEIYYSTDDGETWTIFAQAESGNFTRSFDSTTVPDGQVKIKVCAYDELNNVDNEIYTYIVDNTAPAKVEGLTAVSILSSKLTLAWDKPADKDISHFILEKYNGSSFVKIDSKIDDYLGYNLSNLKSETEYIFRVAAVDINGNVGEYSEEYSVTTLKDTTAPVITKLSPSPNRYNNSISFVTTATDDCSVASMTIQKSTDAVNWTNVHTKTFSSTSNKTTYTYVVSLADEEEGYFYLRTIATDASSNKSDTSTEAPYVQYLVDKTAPNAPTGVKATGHDGYISIEWQQGKESDLGKYSVYRATSIDGEYTCIASSLTTLNHYDRNIDRETTYYYKVRVSDSCGNVSGYSDSVSAVSLDDTVAPVVNSISPATGSSVSESSNQVKVLASDNNMLNKIVVEYKVGLLDTYETLAEFTNINNYYKTITATLPMSELSDGDTIYIRAYSIDVAGLESGYTDAVKLTVDKTAPELEKLNCTVNNSVCTILWNDCRESDLAGFKVYCSVNGGSYSSIGSRSKNSSGKYTFSKTVSEGTYTFRIDCVDKVGNTASYYTDSISVVAPVDLIAKITAESYLEQGVEYIFSASDSVADDTIVSYKWDFGDGTTSGAENPVKSYSDVGEYTVKLTITDSLGNVSTAEKIVTVAERKLLGNVKVTVVDDSGKPIKNAEVYLDLGEKNQEIVYTNSSGIAQCIISTGTHSIGALYDVSNYLPAEKNVVVVAGSTTEVTLVLEKKPLIELELESHEMTFDEIVASGIDVSNPANIQLISGTITVKYTITGSSSTGTKEISYISTPDRIVDYTIKDSGGNSNNSGNNSGVGDTYVFTPVLINGGKDEEIVAVLTMPGEASFLKQFYDVTLYVTNNADTKFSISNCEAALSVPSGLTIVDNTPIVSTISGGSTSSASWIVRGDKKGEYYISASFSGNLDLFNKHVSASITSSEPIVVRGLDGITLRAVFNSMIKNNTLYYNFILENESGHDIYYPNVNYQKLIDNLMIEAPKKDDDTEIVTECLGVSLINSEDIAETFAVDKTFEILQDGEKIKYEFKTSGLANDEIVAYYSEGAVDCLPEFKDHIVVEEGYIHSYDGEEEIVKYTEKYADVFSNQNGLVLRFFDNSLLAEGKIDYVIGSKSGDLQKKLKEVTVEYGNGASQCVDEEFAAKYADVKGYDITIKADGYRTKVIPAEAVEKWATYFSISQKLIVDDIYLEKDHKDGKPYITSAVGKENLEHGVKTYTDLTASKLTVSGAVPCDIIIKAELLGGTNTTYWLSQDNKHREPSYDGKFNSIKIHEKFEKNKDIFVYVVTEIDGKEVVSEPIKLSIEILDLNSYTSELLKKNTISLISPAGQSVSIGDDIPLIGGSTISSNLVSFPIGVEVTGNKVKISFGVDIFSKNLSAPTGSKGSKWWDFKAAVNGWEKGYEDAMKLYDASVFGKASTSSKNIKVNFYGYLEGEIINGVIKPTDYSASLKGQFKYKYTQQGAIYCIPAYAYVEAACSVVVKAVYARQIDDYNVPFDFGFELSVAPSLRVGGGAGIDDVLAAGVFANGIIEYTDNFSKKYRKVKLTGTFGVEAEFFFLKCEKELASGTWTPVDGYYGDSPNRMLLMYNGNAVSSSVDDDFYFDENDLEVVSRDYLEDTSNWNSQPIQKEGIGAATGTLIESIYPDSQNRIVQFGDKLIQVFVEDDESRDSYNFARLMYSIYDNSTQKWSTPKVIYDNGHFDSLPELCVDENDNVYVVWQKLDTTFTSKNATIDDIMKSSEIYYAKYDEVNDKFVDVRKLSSDTLYDSLPSICMENGKPTAYWIKSNNNNLLTEKSNSIIRCEIGSNSEVLASDLNYVSDIATYNDKIAVVYDTDGDTSKLGMQTLTVYSSDGSIVLSEDIEDLSTVQYNKDKLYFTTTDSIQYFDDSGETQYLTSGSFNPQNLTVVNNSAFWFENNSLMYSKYENSNWSSAVVVATDVGNMSNLSVAETEDYAYAVYNSTQIKTDADGNEYAGATSLKFTRINHYVDLSVAINNVNESYILSGEKDNIALYVKNNGNTSVERIKISITDTLGNNSVEYYNVNLAPGGETVVNATYQPKDGYAKATLSVNISSAEGTKEKTPEDNTVNETVGLCDVSVDNVSVDKIGDNYFLSAIITNNSLIAAEHLSVKTHFGSLDNENNICKWFNTLAVGESVYVNIPISNTNLTFDEDGCFKVYIDVTTVNEESILENNTQCFIITEASTECEHTEGDIVRENQVEATYTSDGSYDAVVYCTVCGEELSRETIIVSAKSLVYALGSQIRFHKNDDGTYAGFFDVRTIASIDAADFKAVFGTDSEAVTKIIEVGFVYAAISQVSNLDMDIVKDIVENDAVVKNYKKKPVSNISKGYAAGKYSFACLITDIPDTSKQDGVNAVGYIVWDSDADGTADSYVYYTEVKTVEFQPIFDRFYNQYFV